MFNTSSSPESIQSKKSLIKKVGRNSFNHLPHSEALVIRELALLSDDKGYLFCSYPSIAKRCLFSARTAKRAVQGLQKKGLISKRHTYLPNCESNHSNDYYLSGVMVIVDGDCLENPWSQNIPLKSRNWQVCVEQFEMEPENDPIEKPLPPLTDCHQGGDTVTLGVVTRCHPIDKELDTFIEVRQQLGSSKYPVGEIPSDSQTQKRSISEVVSLFKNEKSSTDILPLWEACLETLKKEVSEKFFISYLQPLQIYKTEDDLIIFTPNKFALDGLKPYLLRISELLCMKVILEIGSLEELEERDKQGQLDILKREAIDKKQSALKTSGFFYKSEGERPIEPEKRDYLVYELQKTRPNATAEEIAELENEILCAVRFGALKHFKDNPKLEMPILYAINVALKLIRDGRWSRPASIFKISDAIFEREERLKNYCVG